MKRSVHVLIAAVVMIAAYASPLVLIISNLIRDVERGVRTRSVSPYASNVYFFQSIPVTVCLLILCVWGVITGIGLVGSRPAARRSAIVLSVVVLAVELPITAVYCLFAWSEGGLSRGALSMGPIVATPAFIAAWWLWLFTRRETTSQFAIRGSTA